MEGPKITDPAFEIDVSKYADVKIIRPHELQSYGARFGWTLLKAFQSESVQQISRTLAYQQPGGYSPATYNYTDHEIVRELAFLIGREQHGLVSDLNAELSRLTSDNCDLENKVRQHEATIAKHVKEFAEVNAKNASLERTRDVQDKKIEELNDAYAKLETEHAKLKQTVLTTLVKLPSGETATLKEATDMIRTHEILGGSSGG